jgi:predicted Zn finger-like uncharacterized protein
MIISCTKCNKKFDVSDDLIPDKGRLLQCGSCAHEWFFEKNKKLELTKQVTIENTENINNNSMEFNDETLINPEIQNFDNSKVKKDDTSFFKILLVIIISFTSLIIVIDTFKFEFSYLIPNLDFYMNSLYEILKDIFLFIKDLV